MEIRRGGGVSAFSCRVSVSGGVFRFETRSVSMAELCLVINQIASVYFYLLFSIILEFALTQSFTFLLVARVWCPVMVYVYMIGVNTYV